jgi:hypothetical protein
MRFHLILAALLVCSSSLVSAQDYPYDDAPEPSPKAELPRESPEDSLGDSSSSKKLPPLFRVGFKFGSDFAFYQYPLTTVTSASHSGFGFDGLVSLGWDLPYQPIFLEMETGYKGLFLTSKTANKTHTIPLRFGTFRRFRTGPQSLLKIGAITSLDFRFQTDETTNQKDFRVVPALALALAWESGGLIFQPEIGIYRIQSQNSFLSFGFLAGYRF